MYSDSTLVLKQCSQAQPIMQILKNLSLTSFILISFLFSVNKLEEQLSRLQREKNDLQSRMEEDQEDMNELMKKHKSAVAQVSVG